ncbi:hypothetical protein N7490_004382 [Penicillium lividum]|nr:hypothetical protein N7490_004382 [Penicillium lividum]
MVTENGTSRYPPPFEESDLRGRRKISQTARLDPLKIDPRAPRTARSTPRSSPRSPTSTYDQRARSPNPPSARSFSDDRPWLPMSLRAGSPQEIPEDWRAKQSVGYPPPLQSPDRQPPRYYPRDNEPDWTPNRKAPPARGGLRISMSTSRLHGRRPRLQESPDRRQELNVHGLPPPRFPHQGAADNKSLRTSVNSAMTSRSSIEQHSGTERSSVLTKSSSITDLSPDTPDAPYGMEDGMSVEDAISMYLDGFSDVTEEPGSPMSRADSKAPSITPPPSRDMHLDGIPPPKPILGDIPPIPPLPQSILPEPIYLQPNIHDPGAEAPSEMPFLGSEPASFEPLERPPSMPIPPKQPSDQSSNIQSVHKREQTKIFIPGPVPPPLTSGSETRDVYGFRKATQYVTREQYETWNGPYSNYTAQRRQKWHAMLQEHGLPTTNPSTFPAQSSKLKRYVRKGIPSEYRGAAWFWYAGGWELLNSNVGLYDELVKKVMATPSNDDKEHIERDLHRTFPDNLHFKPEFVDAAEQAGSGNPTETQMIQSLRRVLYAFALHNPKIGYTQSLNFITGMLLLFLPEEKTFWMLHIITSLYLPGTHEISLEGANIDLWILMVLLRDTMPGIYAKISSMGGSPSGRKTPPLNVNSRLPDITLGLTNWLMSVFIGTLPLETTLRVWDIFFYEGSKTFFRVSLAIFKACERDILAVSDPMEVFQVVQTVPKKLLDANTLMDDCFLRKHRVGQGRIEELRAARRTAVRQEQMRRSVAFSKGELKPATDDFPVRRRNNQPGLEDRVVDSWRHLKHHAFR